MVAPLEAIFPGLAMTEFRVTSPATRAYNCIAWAAGDGARWWWPDPDPDNDAVFWPPNVPREETLEAFKAVYGTLGYAQCDDDKNEPGFEKVALFAESGAPTHAARQLPNGRWTSKLGFLEDIEHDLPAVGGKEYGMVAVVLKRPLAPGTTQG